MNNFDLLISEINERYFRRFIEKRDKISNEEDLRIVFSSLISAICEENNINLPTENHEYRVLKGRIDSLYGEVIVEYKEPRHLSLSNSSKKNLKALEQVQRQILGIEARQKKSSNRFLGVIFDGYHVIFIRRRNNLWDIEDPVPISEKSFKLLLQRLFSIGIQGKALIIDNLIKDFSVLSASTTDEIKILLTSFVQNDRKKINLLFEQWKILFREVCGYDFETKKLEIKELASAFHLENETTDLAKIIFAIQTYYALFIKLLGAETLTYFRHRNTSFISSISENNLRQKITSLENGDIFRLEGINNFNEGDFFSWYLLCWDNKVKEVVLKICQKLKGYDFSSLNLEPKEAKDLIKNIYHYLLPQKLRHSLGEYYTPDWLAEFLLNKLNIDFKKDVRVLDPTCGSGTFLSILIDRIKDNNDIPWENKLQKSLDSIVGIDLNPLAVISAKTNYLIALSEHLQNIKEGGIDIPIYLSDSMLAPLEFKTKHKAFYSLPTKVGVFKIPASLIHQNQLNTLLNLAIKCIDVELPEDKFKHKLTELALKISEEDRLLINEFYSTLLDLQKKGLDGIWAKIIKNIFAPAFFKDFDYIIGNPPWINWQNLPEDYRDSIKKYWEDYKIFLHKGLKARLGSSHDDISVLMTYVVMDKYLKRDGFLGFILPQNLLQSSGGGDGFRRFRIKDDEDVKVSSVDDFSIVQPFADMGASNKPAAIILQKNKQTSYPLPYTKWLKKDKRTIPADQPLSAVLPLLENKEFVAEPIKSSNSSWFISEKNVLITLKALVGTSKYRARKGVDFSLNGLFWGKVAPSKIRKNIIFSNQADIGKKKLPAYKIPIEEKIVFPILRGKDVVRWGAKPEYSAIIPYNNNGKCISKDDLQSDYPNAYKFFYLTDSNLEWLETRGIYQKHLKHAKVPVHGLFDIGQYTFSKYKVVWKALASGMIASVIGNTDGDVLGSKLIIPDHNVLMIPFEDEDEANYLCGVINSKILNDFVLSYVSWFYSSHILENIRIPDFDKNDKRHLRISNLSKIAHKKTKLSDKEQDELNTLVVESLSKK